MLAFLLAPFYLLFNLYLFRRIMGWVRAWFPWFRKRKHWAVPAALYAFFALSFVLAFPLPAGRLKRALMLIGNYWLGVLLYLLLAVLLADGLRLLLVHGLKLRSLRSARMHRIAGCLCAAAILVTSVGGVINARIVRVTPYEITVNKSAGSMESMKVVLLADLHLGYNVGLAQMERMVARVNELDADVVVIAGDIFDNAWEAVEEPEQIAAVLRGIRSRYGVYAVYGNHDIEEPILAGFTFRSDRKKQSRSSAPTAAPSVMDTMTMRMLRHSIAPEMPIYSTHSPRPTVTVLLTRSGMPRRNSRPTAPPATMASALTMAPVMLMNDPLLPAASAIFK